MCHMPCSIAITSPTARLEKVFGDLETTCDDDERDVTLKTSSDEPKLKTNLKIWFSQT